VIGNAFRRLVDLLLPARCLICGAETAGDGLCSECWRGVRFIGPPVCDRCGAPFDYDMGPTAICPACIAGPPRWSRARSILVYDDAGRSMVLSFKHADATHAAPVFARWAARAGNDLLKTADLLVPVPIHRRRLFSRRYNQSALLALEIERVSGVRAAPAALIRDRATPTQGGLSREGRRRNVAGAIRVRDPGAIAGKRVVVIDDVLTTGATVGECARVLLAAGAENVDALTIARVVRG